MGEQKRRKRGLAPRPTSITGERMFHLPDTRSDTYTGTMRAADLADHEARVARRAATPLEADSVPLALHETPVWAGRHFSRGLLDAGGYPALTGAFAGYLDHISREEQRAREREAGPRPLAVYPDALWEDGMEPTLTPRQIGMLVGRDAKTIRKLCADGEMDVIQDSPHSIKHVRLSDFWAWALRSGRRPTELAVCARQIEVWVGEASVEYVPRAVHTAVSKAAARMG
jgi:hypothetical protein